MDIEELVIELVFDGFFAEAVMFEGCVVAGYELFLLLVDDVFVD